MEEVEYQKNQGQFIFRPGSFDRLLPENTLFTI